MSGLTASAVYHPRYDFFPQMAPYPLCNALLLTRGHGQKVMHYIGKAAIWDGPVMSASQDKVLHLSG